MATAAAAAARRGARGPSPAAGATWTARHSAHRARCCIFQLETFTISARTPVSHQAQQTAAVPALKPCIVPHSSLPPRPPARFFYTRAHARTALAPPAVPEPLSPSPAPRAPPSARPDGACVAPRVHDGRGGPRCKRARLVPGHCPHRSKSTQRLCSVLLCCVTPPTAAAAARGLDWLAGAGSTRQSGPASSVLLPRQRRSVCTHGLASFQANTKPTASPRKPRPVRACRGVEPQSDARGASTIGA